MNIRRLNTTKTLIRRIIFYFDEMDLQDDNEYGNEDLNDKLNENVNENSLLLLENVKPASLVLSCRGLLAVVLMMASCIVYMQKIGMSTAIVCMLNNTALSTPESSLIPGDLQCPNSGANSTQSQVNL